VSYTRDISEDRGLMTDVFIATRIPEKNREGQVQLVVADRGGVRIDREHDVRYMELKEGSQYKITPGKHDLELTRFGTMGQYLDEREGNLTEHPDIDGITTADLLQRDDNEAKAAVQWRLSLPVMVLVMSIIALAMSRTNHRKGRYTKMLPAILIYLLYLILMSAMRNALESGKVPTDVGLWPLHGAFFILALVLFNFERLLFAFKRWRS
jgi:lipopolysaccharide export system permease protein